MLLKKNKTVLAVLLVVITIIGLCSCGNSDIDISEYRNQTIELVGLSKDKQEITVAQLQELEQTTKKTKSTSDKIGTVKATGPLLETLLEKYDYKQADFDKIRFYAEDGYDMVLSKKIIDENDIILAIGMDEAPLDSQSRPMRVIIPESDSAYWIRMVNKIEFYGSNK